MEIVTRTDRYVSEREGAKRDGKARNLIKSLFESVLNKHHYQQVDFFNFNLFLFVTLLQFLTWFIAFFTDIQI